MIVAEGWVPVWQRRTVSSTGEVLKDWEILPLNSGSGLPYVYVSEKRAYSARRMKFFARDWAKIRKKDGTVEEYKYETKKARIEVDL